jgi:hypothetical protein
MRENRRREAPDSEDRPLLVHVRRPARVDAPPAVRRVRDARLRLPPARPAMTPMKLGPADNAIVVTLMGAGTVHSYNGVSAWAADGTPLDFEQADTWAAPETKLVLMNSLEPRVTVVRVGDDAIKQGAWMPLDAPIRMRDPDRQELMVGVFHRGRFTVLSEPGSMWRSDHA